MPGSSRAGFPVDLRERLFSGTSEDDASRVASTWSSPESSVGSGPVASLSIFFSSPCEGTLGARENPKAPNMHTSRPKNEVAFHLDCMGGWGWGKGVEGREGEDLRSCLQTLAKVPQRYTRPESLS